MVQGRLSPSASPGGSLEECGPPASPCSTALFCLFLLAVEPSVSLEIQVLLNSQETFSTHFWKCFDHALPLHLLSGECSPHDFLKGFRTGDSYRALPSRWSLSPFYPCPAESHCHVTTTTLGCRFLETKIDCKRQGCIHECP